MSYIKEIHLHNNGCQKARNGNGRSANYDNSYDEKKDSYRFKKPSKYVRSDKSAVKIIHDPLSFHDGGFICGATFGEEEWERMRSSKVITENTVFKQNNRIWRMVTLKCYDGRRMMKRASVEE